MWEWRATHGRWQNWRWNTQSVVGCVDTGVPAGWRRSPLVVPDFLTLDDLLHLLRKYEETQGSFERTLNDRFTASRKSTFKSSVSCSTRASVSKSNSCLWFTRSSRTRSWDSRSILENAWLVDASVKYQYTCSPVDFRFNLFTLICAYGVVLRVKICQPYFVRKSPSLMPLTSAPGF